MGLETPWGRPRPDAQLLQLVYRDVRRDIDARLQEKRDAGRTGGLSSTPVLSCARRVYPSSACLRPLGPVRSALSSRIERSGCGPTPSWCRTLLAEGEICIPPVYPNAPSADSGAFGQR